MFDPIGAFIRIRDFYISYLETAFSIQNRQVSAERRTLLESGGSLCTEPIIEPLTRYKAADFVLTDVINDQVQDDRVPGLDVRQRQAFVHLALSGLFDSEPSDNPLGAPRAKYPPYTHQVEMLRRGIAVGEPSVVTSGTGSGKRNPFCCPSSPCWQRRRFTGRNQNRDISPIDGGRMHQGARSTSTPTFPTAPWRRIGTVHRSLRRERVRTRNAAQPFER